MQVAAVGELLLEVGSAGGWGPSRLSAAQLDDVLARLTEAADGVAADVTVLKQGPAELPGDGA